MSTTAPSWLGRNWKWVVPLGCFTVVAGLLAFIAGLVLVVFGFVRSSDVYRHALERASSHPAVLEALGEPVAPGWHVSGSIDSGGARGPRTSQSRLPGPEERRPCSPSR